MDASVEAWKNLLGFVIILEYAASELFLNILLLICAVFYHLLTKFAGHYKLQTPCILCSRLDRMLDGEKPGSYCNQLRSDHRSEISILASCCIHGNLADGNSMCDECLLSCADNSKSNSDIDRLLTGRFGSDRMRMRVRLCSCCNKPWKSRQDLDKPRLLKPTRSGKTTPNIPLPARRLNHREELKKMKERFSGSATLIAFDHLPHVGYKELKINSDSESEFPFSDDEEGSISTSSVTRIVKEPKEVPPITLTNYFSFEANKDSDWGQRSAQKTYPTAMPELISLDDFPVFPQSTAGKPERKFHSSQNVLSELMSLVDAPSLFNSVKAPLDSSKWKLDGTGTSSERNTLEEILESATTAAGESLQTDRSAYEATLINSTRTNQTDELKSRVISKETEASAKEPEPKGDANLFPSENTCSPDVGLQDRRDHGDELQIADPSNPNGAQMLQEKSLITALESIVGSSTGEVEVEGENVVERLKKQIEIDRRCINALYRELEEERNASAIAANQAMAMITRLQEEKASLHMEALQYLRMMEDQAEYDVEALEKANDLLAEKEKEIQDMEADMEYFRLQFFDDPGMEIMPYDLQKKSTTLDYVGENFAKDDATMPSTSSNDQENPIDIESSYSELEDEKVFVSECLQDSEKKVCQVSHHDSDSEETANRDVNKDEPLETVETGKRSNDTSVDGDQIAVNVQNIDPKSNGQLASEKSKENEIGDLNERLEALENDWHFLEHTLNSLQTGKEGLQLVQGIARQIQELRKAAMKDRSQCVP